MRSIRQAFLALACASALLTPLFTVLPVAAQVAGATITGVLTDTSGAVVPGVQVTVRNLDTGITNSAPSNSWGAYLIPNMTPGKYHIVFAAPGFSRVERDLMLSVGSVETLSVTMPLGQASTVVEVKTNVELNAENATVSGEIDGTALRELPLNGRDWSQLAELQPNGNCNRLLQLDSLGSRPSLSAMHKRSFTQSVAAFESAPSPKLPRTRLADQSGRHQLRGLR